MAILINRPSFDHDSKEWNYHVLQQKENALLQKFVKCFRGSVSNIVKNMSKLEILSSQYDMPFTIKLIQSII